MTCRRRTIRSLGDSRRGAVILESAVVLGVFLTILLGGLDLALAILRDNTISEAARRLARAAIVHGEDAAPIHGSWGPAPHDGTADESDEFADSIRDTLVVMDPADVRIRVEWPDGGNATGDRVHVLVATEHQSLLASLFGSDPYVLQATSTMRIEH